MPITQHGIVEYFGMTGSEHKCGYCKGMKPADSDYGMWAHQLKPLEYLLLMERGWRRSGKYCYHPIRSKTCCPPYAIRCDAKDFRPTKSQRKCLKRVNRFLADGVIPADRHRDSNPLPESMKHTTSPDLRMSKRNVTGATLSPDPSRDHVSSKANEVDVKAVPVTASVTPAPERSSRAESSSKDPSNKAKIKRIERKIHKVMLHEACTREAAESLVRGAHEDKVKRLEEVHVLENLLQEDAGAKHRIEVRMVRTSLDEDSVKEKAFHQTILPLEHAVYSRYQMDIHKDEPEECTVKQYSRFLCDTPILFTPFPNGQFVAGIPGFGSYHMQYWLDGVRLMAVGVIDILPTGLSSVYLFYDPEFSFLGLGTYSALRELALVRQLMQQFLPCRYYYMGFYIHSCCKMRYKGKFLPSDLLCPEVRTWHPIQQAMKLLDVNKYSRLNPDETVVDEESRGICDQAIGVVIAGHGTSNYFRYQDLKSEDPDLPTTEQKVREYASLVGRKAVKSLLLYLE